MQRVHWQLAIVGVAIVVSGAVLYRYVFSSSSTSPETPAPAVVQQQAEALVEQIKKAPEPEAKRQAVAQLTQLPITPVPQLRQVIAQRDVPDDSRARAIESLGDVIDWDSVPALLKLCEDPSPLVRGRAAAAVQKIFGADYHYKAEAPEAERRKMINTWKLLYEKRVKEGKRPYNAWKAP